MIEVLRAGLQDTVQDLGRTGYREFGVVRAGAADRFAFRVANLLVGNTENAPGLEITLRGPKLRFEEDAVISITGFGAIPKVDGIYIPTWRPVYIASGSILDFEHTAEGCRTYLAIAGGLQIPEILDSASTYLRAQLGGYEGRSLKRGDRLSVGVISKESLALSERIHASGGIAKWHVSTNMWPSYSASPILRVLRGPEWEQFTRKSRFLFLSSHFKVTPQSDRMGCRVSGQSMTRESGAKELISTGVLEGTIQVPANGQPIILLADAQTTGGYPRIAQVASVDLPVLAQLRPGTVVSFRIISLDKAQRLLREQEANIQQLHFSIHLI